MKSARKLQIIILVVILGLVLGTMLTRGDRRTNAMAAGVVVDEVPGSQNLEMTLSTNSIQAATAPWFIIEIETPNDVGQYASLALNNSRGSITISHFDATNQTVRVASYPNNWEYCNPQTNWGCIELDGASGYISTALNPDTGGPGITYHDATFGSLKYTYFEQPTLKIYRYPFTIDRGIPGISSTGLYASLVYDNDGRPYISYQYNSIDDFDDALMLAYYTGTMGNCVNGDYPEEWQCNTIITGVRVGQYTSLVIENLGNSVFTPHIAYYDGGKGELWYATRVAYGTGNCGPHWIDWVCYPISGGSIDVGKYASMYVDDAGKFHIAYYDDTNNQLKYAVNGVAGGNCGLLGSAQCDTIDDMPEDTHPVGISIAEDPAGYPVIAYQDKFGALNLARPLAALGKPAGSGNCGPGETWYCRTIYPYNPGVPARQGDYISLAINPSGLGTIAYYGFITSSSGGNLMVAQQCLQTFIPLVMNIQ